jgi:NAD(P)-dependent dehydrogenase (short-subunit alcohol dehydrogenase family)
MRLGGKVAIVTGASSGLGKAIARRFAAEGASVVVVGRRKELGESVASSILTAGGKAIYAQADVSRAADIENVIKRALDGFGRLDILVNNAGVNPSMTAVVDMTEENWDHIVATNLKGVFLCSKFSIPEMVRGGGGAIVNVSSVTSLIGIKARAGISATKGGVTSLTRSMAVDYGPQNVRVNCICPSFIETEMTAQFLADKRKDPAAWEQIIAAFPLRKLGTPDDVASAALFLASEESRWITGISLSVDGGHAVA